MTNNLLIPTIFKTFAPARLQKIDEGPIHKRSDEALVELYKAGLPGADEAFEEIPQRYKDLVLNRCSKIIGNRADAEEVCQDVFVQVHRKIGQFEGRSSFSTWLYRVVHNKCLDRKRALSRRRENYSTFVEQHDTETETPTTHLGVEDLCEDVRNTLEKIDVEKRELMRQRFEMGLTLQEIADSSQLQLSATKMRLYRALDEFKTVYQREYQQTA